MEILWIFIGIIFVICILAKENAYVLGYAIGTFLRFLVAPFIVGVMMKIVENLRYEYNYTAANVVLVLTIIGVVIYFYYRIKNCFY